MRAAPGEASENAVVVTSEGEQAVRRMPAGGADETKSNRFNSLRQQIGRNQSAVRTNSVVGPSARRLRDCWRRVGFQVPPQLQ